MSPFGRCLSFPSPSPNLDPHPGRSAKKPRPVQNVKYPQPPFFFLRQPPFSFLTTTHPFLFSPPPTLFFSHHPPPFLLRQPFTPSYNDSMPSDDPTPYDLKRCDDPKHGHVCPVDKCPFFRTATGHKGVGNHYSEFHTSPASIEFQDGQFFFFFFFFFLSHPTTLGQKVPV